MYVSCNVCVAVAFKVIYVDDYSLAVLYTCLDEQSDGTCEPSAQHVSIISRSRDVSQSIRRMSRVYDVITETLCVDVYSLQKPHVEGKLHYTVEII